MCLVIDACMLARVFDATNKEHTPFSPILKWLLSDGKMIFGGTKYNNELQECHKFVKVVNELVKGGRAIQLSGSKVDSVASQLKARFTNPNFNDEHLVALVVVSRCGVVCTDDDGAITYLGRVDIFASYKLKRPKIYRGHRTHKELCCAENILGVCRKDK